MAYYGNNLIKGLQCGICSKQFLFINAKKNSWWRTDAVIECPRCKKQLEYPKQVKLWGVTIRLFCFVAVIYLILNFSNSLKLIFELLPAILIFIGLFLFIKSFGLNNGHIILNKHEG